MKPATPNDRAKMVLEGHRRGHYNVQETVNLLEALWQQESEDGRKAVEAVLWNILRREPLKAHQPISGNFPDILRVSIRAIATFGSTVQLPPVVFGRLPTHGSEQIGVWANSMCSELSYSMFHHADRFTEATFMLTQSFCSTQTFPDATELFGFKIDQVVAQAAANLEQTIEHIEFKRFGDALIAGQQPARKPASELQNLLAAIGITGEIAHAMEEAETYLYGTGKFEAKHALDLVRACMEETHRGVIAELEKMTGQKCDDPGKDGFRRAYMRRVGFINDAEDQFFSSIYTLLSKEGSHKLLAPKETALVMYSTVKEYLLLLLRRLRGKRESFPSVGQ